MLTQTLKLEGTLVIASIEMSCYVLYSCGRQGRGTW